MGWVLLQVNADGIIESCTQNIRELIGYEKQELYKKPLYSYLYPGDHAKLNPIINNMSYNSVPSQVGIGGGGGGGGGNGGSGMGGWGVSDGADDQQQQANSGGSTSTPGGGGSSSSTQQPKAKSSISTKVRMLVKDPLRLAMHGVNVNDAMDPKALRQLQQQQQDKFEEVVLIAAPVKGELFSFGFLATFVDFKFLSLFSR